MADRMELAESLEFLAAGLIQQKRNVAMTGDGAAIRVREPDVVIGLLVSAAEALRANTDPSLERVEAMRLASLLGDADPTLSRQGYEITLSCPDSASAAEIFDALEAAAAAAV